MIGLLRTPEPVWTFGKTEQCLGPDWNQTLDHPTSRLVTIRSTLSSHAKDDVYVQSQKATTLKMKRISDVFFLPGDSMVSEFYVLIFRNTLVCSIFIAGVSRKNNQDENVRVSRVFRYVGT